MDVVRQGDGDMEREAMRALALGTSTFLPPPPSAPEPPNHWRWRMRRGGGGSGPSVPKRVRESTSHWIRNSDMPHTRDLMGIGNKVEEEGNRQPKTGFLHDQLHGSVTDSVKE